MTLQADKSDYRFMGLDLIKGEVVNNLRAGVVEPSLSKVKSLHFATEAAISILRIDDFIKVFCVVKLRWMCKGTPPQALFSLTPYL